MLRRLQNEKLIVPVGDSAESELGLPGHPDLAHARVELGGALQRFQVRYSQN
jgi:hypothetical protein